MGSLPADDAATLVVIDPDQPERVYAAGESLFRSDDAGQTWQAAADGLPADGVAALALDPNQPQRLYAATATGEVFLSEDGATTWRRVADAGGDGAT